MNLQKLVQKRELMFPWRKNSDGAGERGHATSWLGDLLKRCFLLLVFFFLAAGLGRAQSSIALVQHTSKDAGTTASSTLAFPSANLAGNWIGVVIRAGQPGETFTVKDSSGNIYRQALLFNETGNGNTLGIFYAESIAGGANTITVSMTASNTLRFAILEYSGVAASGSLDVTAAAQGKSTAANSGNAMTTASGDLLLGAVLTGNAATFTAGSGYKIEESVPAEPSTKLIAEDQKQSTAGMASASAQMAASDNWAAGLAAFKAAGGPPPPVPNISTLSQGSGAVGTPITITGSNFGSSQSTSTVTFGGVSAGTASSWGAGSITVNVPIGAMTGNVVVTVSGVASNGVNFMVTGGAITLVQRTGVDAGTTTSSTLAFTSKNTAGNWIGVVIRGGISGEVFTVTDSLGNTYQKATQFNETLDGDTLGIFYVENCKGGANTVTVKDTISATLRFAILEYSGLVTAGSLDAVTAAQGTSLSPSSGNAPTTVSGDLLLGAVLTGNAATYTAGSGYFIEQAVPAEPNSKLIVEDQIQAAAGPISAGASLAAADNWAAAVAAFKAAGGTPPPTPNISTLSQNSGAIGTAITITGTNFGSSQSTSTVTFNGFSAGTATSWATGSITVNVPATATTGNVVVTVSGVASNGVMFTVAPNITGLSKTIGAVGTAITITGTNFGSTQGSVTFGGTAATTFSSWSATSIGVTVPAGASTGNVVVTAGALSSNGVSFTVILQPNISTLSQSSGAVDTPITIMGSNFGSSQSTSTVTFGGVSAGTASSWGAGSITVNVPIGAMTGNVVVTVSGVASNGVNFMVTGGAITLVQRTGVDAGTTTSSTLAFTSKNTAGNWIGVVIRGGISGEVFTVTDSLGNTYQKATQFNETLDGDTLGIFYVENCKGGANTVTVKDTISATLRFAILEYSGLVTAGSLDAVTAAQGTSLSPSSGNAPTTVSGDLLLGAVLTGNAATYTAGSGYFIEQAVPAEPNSKLIVEDQIQAAAGPISAGASLAASDNWAAGLAAFRSANAGPPPPVSVTISPTMANVANGQGTQLFTTTVQSDPHQLGVTFALSGAGCSGITCGSLTNVTTTSATYNGPTNIPNPATVTLTATAVTDTTKFAQATITVVQGPLSVAVSPKHAAITPSQTQLFAATVFNDPLNGGVTWSVDGNNGGTATSGTVSTAGLFTPGTQAGPHTVTATSNSNSAISASSMIAVTDLAGVFTYHNDNSRTGQNLNEYALTTTTANSSTFGMLFSCPVDGYVYAQPLYFPNLSIGGTTRNVIFIATEHDSVYAFDADSPSCLQLWKTSFLGTGVTTMPYTDTAVGTSNSPTDDVSPEIGITSTPVIDPSPTGKTIYVEAKTKETVGTGCSTSSPCYVHRLHALDVALGSEKFDGPMVITAPNFVSLRHFNRPGLLFANGTVYVGFGSHGDISPWFGWMFGYDAGTLARQFVFNASDPTSGSNGASVWGGGAGPATDASGNVYFVTGNGTYDGEKNFSESIIKISSTGTLLDWFRPSIGSTLDSNDIDMGSSGLIILPDSVGSTAHPHLALAAGKLATLFLLDQTNLGKFNSTNMDLQEVTPIPPPNTTNFDGGLFGLPGYFNGNIYTTGVGYPLSQFKISNGVIATPQFAESTNLFPLRGGTPSISASGSTNGIVWILDLTGWQTGAPAILDAYDANNVSTLLYSSPTNGANAAGAAVKFTVPTVANGKVYVGGQSTFTVFGLNGN